MPMATAFSSSAGGGAPVNMPAAAGSLRMWLCATLQPLLSGRPSAKQAFLSSGGISILCRHLAAGPEDVAVHACGVLTSVLGQGGGGEGGENEGRQMEAEAAAEVCVYVCVSLACVSVFVFFVVLSWEMCGDNGGDSGSSGGGVGSQSQLSGVVWVVRF